MSRALLVCAAAACIAGGGALRADQAQVASPVKGEVPFFEYTQRWFKLVQTHQIGEWDASAAAAAKMPLSGLNQIKTDLNVIYLLLDAAIRKGEDSVDAGGRTLHLKSLATLIGVEPAELERPKPLQFLGDRHQKTRRVLSRVMTRAAMMHTRIAVERSLGMEPEPRSSRVGATVTLIKDGRTTLIPNRSVHWSIARAAFDIDGPPRAASATAKLWYQASMAYLQQERDYSALLPHSEHARTILKHEPLAFLFSGAAYENLASPRVQAAIDESDGTIRALGSPRELLQSADRNLQEALTLDPDLALAQLRRGRVLDLLGRHQEAVTLLQKADEALTDLPSRYLASLFLGKAEQALGHEAEARTAYEKAMSLYPSAPSPRLALASIAWRANDRTQAGTGVRSLPALATDDVAADPFWTYDARHVGDVPALFEKLRVMAIEAVK